MAARPFIYLLCKASARPGRAARRFSTASTLSFYPDAKIGVLGVQRLWQVDASAHRWPDSTPNSSARVSSPTARGSAICRRSLNSTPRSTPRATPCSGSRTSRRSSTPTVKLAMNYSDETADEMTRLQDEIEAKGLWDLDSQVEQAMDALGCPPDDADVTKLSRGERRTRRARRLLLEKARPVAARRADQPPRRQKL